MTAFERLVFTAGLVAMLLIWADELKVWAP